MTVFEDGNNRVVQSLETVRDVIDSVYDRVEDDWYRTVLTDVSEIAFYLGHVLTMMNSLSYPIWPGKYRPILDEAMKYLEGGQRSRAELRDWMVSRHIPWEELPEVFDCIGSHPNIVRRGYAYSLKDGADPNPYVDAETGHHDRDKVIAFVNQCAERLGIRIGYVFVDNPFGDPVDIQLEDAEGLTMKDVKGLRDELEREFGCDVSLSILQDGEDVLSVI